MFCPHIFLDLSLSSSNPVGCSLPFLLQMFYKRCDLPQNFSHNWRSALTYAIVTFFDLAEFKVGDI